ncbi:hypothetical protein D3C81_792100 [compost metagenome]
MQLRLAGAVVLGGFLAGDGQRAERVGIIGAQGFQGVVEVVRVPEALFRALRHLLQAHQIPCLGEDHDPRGERHDQQNDCGRTHDEVALRPEVGESEVLHGLVPGEFAWFRSDQMIGNRVTGTGAQRIGDQFSSKPIGCCAVTATARPLSM